MPSRLSLLAAFAVGLLCVLSMQCSGGSSKCNATTCATGCCDSTGACKTGVDNAACGKGGATCSSCQAGQVCALQVCSGGAGGGAGVGGGLGVGGGVGGGSAGGAGGGGPVTCRQITTFTGVPASAGYDPGNDYSYGSIANPDPALSTTTSYAQASMEFWYGAGAVVPSIRSFDGGITFQNCDVCLYYDEQCDPSSGVCSKNFLMQSGEVNVITGSADQVAGRIAGSATNLTFVQWDFDQDAPVMPGECVQMGRFDLDVTWDAGLSTPDGGADGGDDAG